MKWRLFRHWLDNSHPDAEADYLWHIDQRQGAQLPLACYLPKARKLFESMQAHGFDPEHAVPVNQAGTLLEGAHRTACATALGIKAHVLDIDTDHKWPDWGRAWFLSHGMAPQIPGLLAEYEVLTSVQDYSGNG